MKKNINETEVVNEEVVNETEENVVKEETMNNEEQAKKAEEELKADIKKAKKAVVKKFAINALMITGELLLCAASGYMIGRGLLTGMYDAAGKIGDGSAVKHEGNDIIVDLTTDNVVESGTF